VCEHQQASADECEVCGKRLSAPGAAAPAFARLEGLEPTLAPPVEVAPEPVPELEPTRHGAAGEEPAGAAGWVEGTRAEVTGPVAVEQLPDVEHHRAEPIPDGGPDPDAPLTCRYCRTVAAPGERLCGRCGMKLSRFDAGRVAAELAGMLCRDCGARGEGPRCRRCGARMVSP
jgi:hypothetical protein